MEERRERETEIGREEREGRKDERKRRYLRDEGERVKCCWAAAQNVDFLRKYLEHHHASTRMSYTSTRRLRKHACTQAPRTSHASITQDTSLSDTQALYA